MKSLSLKIEEQLLVETEKVLAVIKKTRNSYISEALKHYNKMHQQKTLAKQLAKESKIVREESMKVLAEFEKFEDED